MAAVVCPSPNPIVNENNCSGAGTSAWRLSNYSENIGGFSTKTSFAKGEDVPLKIGRNVATGTRVDITVYRTGFYGNTGGRLITAASATDVVVNNTFACRALDTTTGKLDCGNWNVTYTIPGSALPATGVYVAKLRATDAALENWIIFVVRDDNRVPEAKVLVVVPTATWQAYNTWGGKSLYFDKNGGPNSVAGTPRAVKVSFNRPLDHATEGRDRYLGPDYFMVVWLERQGYDVAYTDDVRVHQDPQELRQHEVVLITGHSEYWSLEEFNGFKAARDAGVDIASFSANTAYWKVRYEESDRTLVCYKTVQGDGSGGSGQISANDWGPDGLQGTSDDALGLDGRALTADDHPENSSTTFRDDGAPQGDVTAPPGGRVGPNLPENSLFGIMYVGDNDSTNFPLTVPAGNGAGEFASDRIWRNTGIPSNATTNIGSALVGWEWDAVPSQAQYLAQQPAGVKRLFSTNVQTANDNSWLLDEGRQRSNVPPSGQPGTVTAVKYTASSGAIVFASGTMHWAVGLSETPDPRIWQATYNILADMGAQPGTPESITLDPADGPPRAVINASPPSGPVPLTTSFDGTGSTDDQGPISRYEWDLDGDGFDDGSAATATFTYTSMGTYNARLRVTDSAGQQDIATFAVTAGSPPTAVIQSPASTTTWSVGQTMSFLGSASDGNGAPIPASGLGWQLVLVHTPPGETSHEHVLQSWTGVAQGSFIAPDHAAPSYLRLELTATDSLGLRTTVQRRIDPQMVSLTLASQPTGVQLTFDGDSATAPFARQVIAGSAHTIAAPTPQNLGTSTYLFGSWSDAGGQTHTITAPAASTTYQASYTLSAVGVTLVGTETVEPNADSNPAGVAEAFRTTANASGPVGFLFVYQDGGGSASEIVAGLYSDVAGKPGALLTTGRLTSPVAGGWNRVTVPAAQVSAGTTYWIAVLGPAGKPGTLRFRDLFGGGRAETSAQTTLTDLPTNWATGAVYTDGPLSAYGAAIAGPPQPPVLTVAPTSLTFNGTAGAANPATQTLSITNTGGGTLNFSTSDDQPWLAVSPATGSAPQSLSVSVTTTGLSAGTYTGTVTIDATGATGSPKQLPITLNLAAAPPPSTGLVAAYGFEEASGTTVNDVSGRGNNGTLFEAARITTGKNGRALSFDGVNDWVTIPDAPSLDLSNQMTLMAWVYPTSLGSLWRTVLIKEQVGQLVYALYASSNASRPSGHVYVNRDIDTRGTAALPLNTWSHIAVTFDGGTLRFYRNGTLASSRAIVGSMPNSAQPLRIGGNAVWGEWYQGRIDDVRVYSRPLTAAEIGADSSAGVTG